MKPRHQFGLLTDEDMCIWLHVGRTYENRHGRWSPKVGCFISFHGLNIIADRRDADLMLSLSLSYKPSGIPVAHVLLKLNDPGFDYAGVHPEGPFGELR